MNGCVLQGALQQLVLMALAEHPVVVQQATKIIAMLAGAHLGC